ncbi:MAG: hypothetical protein CL398_03560 [Acidiferrobacteraceae bacterium]|nr:hypothetical protein [Acidiferrobacteraceae bacterium]
MVERISALIGHYQFGHFGKEEQVGVVLSELPNLSLIQVATWPENFQELSFQLAKSYGIKNAPEKGKCAAIGDIALLHVEPLKWWCYGPLAPLEIPIETGASLDISHSRAHVRLSGTEAHVCLNRLISVDLRSSACPVGSIVSTSLHHVGVTIWHSKDGYELFVPRGFAIDLWDILKATAEQFGLDIA